MPEEQKPFIYQDGTATPPGPASAAELLHTSALAKLVQLFKTDEAIIKSRETDALSVELRGRRHAIETVQLLQEPRVNMTVTALKTLDPTMQALVSDIAIALSTDPAGRQTLANALRKLVEGRP